MGIRGLLPFLRARWPHLFHDVDLADFDTVCVDTSIYVHKWVLGRDRRADPHAHVRGALMLVKCLRKCAVRPCFIYDGEPPDAKQGELDRRAAVRDGADAPVTPRHFVEVRDYLDLAGVAQARARGESDPYLTAMCRSGIADACMTEDMDMLVLGCPRVLTRVDVWHGRATMLVLDEILGALELTHAQFIDMCVMFGCDYVSTTIPKIGPVNAWKLIREYGTIENVFASTVLVCPAGFTYVVARGQFTAPPVRTIDAIAEVRPMESLRRRLREYGFDADSIDKLLS